MLHVQIFYEVEVGDCFSDIAWKFKRGQWYFSMCATIEKENDNAIL